MPLPSIFRESNLLKWYTNGTHFFFELVPKCLDILRLDLGKLLSSHADGRLNDIGKPSDSQITLAAFELLIY